jgi:tight adherence protein B
MIRRLGPLAAVVSILLLLAGPALLPAGAQDQGDFLEVLAVDARSPDATELLVTWTGSEEVLGETVLTEQGETRAIESIQAVADGTPGVVVVIDNSEAMDAALADAKRAATGLVENLPDGAEVAVMGVGDGPQVFRDFTGDRDVAIAAIDSLVANGAPAVADGLRASAALFSEDDGLQPNVVLITGTTDGGSAGTFGQARGELSLGGVSVQILGIGGAAFDQDTYQSVVDLTGGRLLVAGDSDGVVPLGEEAATAISSRYQIVYPPATGDGAGDVVDVTLTTGETSTSISYVRGTETVGPGRLAPVESTGDGGIAFLQNDMVKNVALVMAAFAIGLAAYAMIMVFQRDDSALTSVLQPYADGFVDGEDDTVTGEDRTAIYQRAVDMTEDFAERQGFLAKIEGKLERAALPLRAAEALFFYGVALVLVTALAFLISGNLLATLLIAVVVGIVPFGVLNFLGARRQKAFVAQLPDMLQLLSGTLRAGYSLMQGVEAVSKEVGDPIGTELRRVVTEARLGRPLEEALDAAAERMDSEDFSWAVMAVRIQREVGGNLAELLLTVAETMTQRERLRRDVAALTAEGKISAIVLGMLPPAIGAAMFVINPEYIGVLFDETIGNMMLAFAVVLAGFGFWWMKKTIEIEI